MTRLLLLCACTAAVLTPLAASVAEPILAPARPALEAAPLRTALVEPVAAAPQAARVQEAQPSCTRKVRVVGTFYGEPVVTVCRTEAPAQAR